MQILQIALFIFMTWFRRIRLCGNVLARLQDFIHFICIFDSKKMFNKQSKPNATNADDKFHDKPSYLNDAFTCKTKHKHQCNSLPSRSNLTKLCNSLSTVSAISTVLISSRARKHCRATRGRWRLKSVYNHILLSTAMPLNVRWCFIFTPLLYSHAGGRKKAARTVCTSKLLHLQALSFVYDMGTEYSPDD